MPEIFNLTVGQSLPYTVVSSTNMQAGSLANLSTLQPGEKASSLTLAAGNWCRIIVDLGASVPIRQIALLYTNFRPSLELVGIDTANALDFSDSIFLGNSYGDQTTRPSGYVHFLHHHSTTVTARYIAIYVNNLGSTNYTYEIGRLFVSNPLQLEYNPDFGSTSWGYEEADEGEILDSGVEILVERAAAPVLNFTATWVTQAELDAGWEELGRLQHEGTPVLVVRRPDPHAGRHNGIYYGRLRMVPVVAAEYDMFEVQGRIRSML